MFDFTFFSQRFFARSIKLFEISFPKRADLSEFSCVFQLGVQHAPLPATGRSKCQIFLEDQRMKKFFTIVFALSMVVSASRMKMYAQGKAQARAVDQNRALVKDAKPDKDKDAGKQPNEVKKENTEDGKIVEHIDRNPQLKARVQHLLPANMSLNDAAAGFRNQGQFIATLHVANNLNIPFTELKSKVTGDHPMPLGKAIRELWPNLTEKQATDVAKTAEKQAKETADTKPLS